VFAAGDAVTGAKAAIQAVAAAKRTALAIDAWLSGADLSELESKLTLYGGLPYLEQVRDADQLGELGQRLAERSPVWLTMGIAAERAPRARRRALPAARRLDSFDEVDQGLAPAAARAEAARCLQCACDANGSCELQRLGIEYDITENELVVNDARATVPGVVRREEPDQRHPFIDRDMDKCIACGRCVRVCAEVAGPACYDFSGRGFRIKVDTPYGESLQLADCITCGRCVTACPTGALSFNQRALQSFKVDESRCTFCHQCVDVCPVDAITETNVFEQGRKQWHVLVAQGTKLAGGHRLCAGCGAPIVVRQVLMGTTDPVVTAAATGCLEVSTTIYPYTSWKNSYIHTAFENVAATLSGVETAYRALKKQGKLEDNVKFIAFGGDGGTYDIGLQSLSGAMERGHDMVYVCYDNGAYMNTGFQRSGATPLGAWTTTSPVGAEQTGKMQQRKNLTDIMVAHGIPYVAQASPHDPRDLVRKAAKAINTPGPAFLNIISPCPRGWRSDGASSIELAREAVNTCYWPLFEVENGVYHLDYRPLRKEPVRPWLKKQGRFGHLFKPGNEHVMAALQDWIDGEWDALLEKCGEPSEAEWQTAHGVVSCEE
jgi:pyruvate ferredoxin oxidoreductase beta subunit